MFGVLGEQVLGVEHLLQGSAAGREPAGHFLGQRLGPAPLLPLQCQDAKLDVAFGNVVGRQPQAIQIGLDGTVEVPCLRGLAGSFEVALRLRLCVSIRFRHNVVKSLSFQMMYPSPW